jgi:hypothetical protein
MEETTNVPAIRLLFNNKERVETLTLDELKKTNIAHADLQRSRTTPVAHYELIDTLMSILTEAGQAPVLDVIYATNQGGSTALRNIEEQYGNQKNILQAWLLRKITGKIFIPRLETEDMKISIAFAYHDKGIDVAFGHDVSVCSNMSIFGSHILHTYGANQNVDYEKLIDTVKVWANNLDKMAEEDIIIIKNMMATTITKEKAQEFLGKLLLLANAANMNKPVVSPLNVTQVSEVSKGLLSSDYDIFNATGEYSLWNFYNDMTAVLKAGNSDISTLLTDVTEIGNMLVKEFNLSNVPAV